MKRNDIEGNAVIKHAIEQWPVRTRRAGKRQADLAVLAGTSEGHLSQILNFKINNPRTSTLDKIEKALQSWGV